MRKRAKIEPSIFATFAKNVKILLQRDQGAADEYSSLLSAASDYGYDGTSRMTGSREVPRASYARLDNSLHRT